MSNTKRTGASGPGALPGTFYIGVNLGSESGTGSASSHVTRQSVVQLPIRGCVSWSSPTFLRKGQQGNRKQQQRAAHATQNTACAHYSPP